MVAWAERAQMLQHCKTLACGVNVAMWHHALFYASVHFVHFVQIILMGIDYSVLLPPLS